MGKWVLGCVPLHVWVSGSLGVCVPACLGDWVAGWLDGWVAGRMGVCVSACLCVCVYVGKCVSG